MGFPSDINLPSNARYYTFVEEKKKFNSNYDITWSFQYKIPSSSIEHSTDTGNDLYQLGFATFLTTLSSPISSLPGQYIGDTDPARALSGGKLFTEGGNAMITTQEEEFIIVEERVLSGTLVKIAFDTTGRYALSGRDSRPGIEPEYLHREALVVRDYNSDVVLNTPLSTMSTTFSSLSTDNFRTLRFRYANLGRKLYIDFRDTTTTTYSTLTTVNLGYRLQDFSNLDNIYCGFAFTTPVDSTNESLCATQFFLKNFHVEGYEGYEVLTETVTSAQIPVSPNTNYSTVTNITARNITTS